MKTYSFWLVSGKEEEFGYMAGVDNQLTNLEARRAERQSACEKRKNIEKQRQELSSGTVQLASSSSSTSESEAEGIQSTAHPKARRKRARKNIISPEVATALDRSQISDRKAVYILSAAASSPGHEVNELAVNRSSIRRS
jgi:hypothetical protein